MSKNIDMTSGTLGDKILKYAVTLAITGALQQLFTAADIAVVGRFAGKTAMAAVGGNAPVINLLINLFVGISLGTNVVIAKSIGQKNASEVKKAVHTSFVVALIGGVMISLLGEAIAPDVVRMLKVPDEVYGLSVEYLRIYLLGMPVILLYNFEAAIFRSCGNTKTPLIALVISGVLNVALNILFVVGYDMDVEGVAIATVLANFVSSLILLIALIRTDEIVKVNIKSIRVHKNVLKQMLQIGVPAGVQGMIFSFANIIVQSGINSLGTTVIAASSAALNLEIFAFYIMNSYGQATTTFVGQNYGAKEPKRCRKVLKLCIIQDYIITSVACILILVFSDQLLALFNTDPDVISVGRIRLEYIFIGYLFSMAQEPLTGYLRGFGISFVPALCSVVGICVVRLTWIFTVFKQAPSFTKIMEVYPLSLGLTAFAILVMVLIIKPSRRYIKVKEASEEI
ncbi:MAG: MATE family efflux transporter [Lachnospiraceae bacterium]|nr:MATE family efflux transporter [Lachnospiraceae bacterium]